MRIISGKHKGRKLNTFDGLDIRPTSDMARESLFNIIGADVLGCDFLDLFAGSGAVGIESLSRGANSVIFVDKSSESLKLVRKNLDLIKENAKIIKDDSISFLAKQTKPFDIIFCDPPYNFEDMEKVFNLILQNKLIKENGLIVYEHSKDRESKIFDGFVLEKSRKYGYAVFDMYRLGE